MVWLVIVMVVQSGTVPGVCQSRRLEIGVFKDVGVGPSSNNLIDVLSRHEDIIHMTLLSGKDVCGGALKNFDVFIVPGGSGHEEGARLGNAGAAEVKRFVSNGGCYVGICAGFYLASNESDFLGLLPVGIRDRKHWFRGKTTLPIEFTQAGADVFGVDPGMADIVYHNGPIVDWRPVLANPQLSKNLRVLSYFRGEIVAKGGEVGVMNGAPAMVLGRYGRGLVLGMSPHAEQTPPLNKIIPHALRWLCANMSSASSNATATSNVTARQPGEKHIGEHQRNTNVYTQPTTESIRAANPLAQKAFDRADWVFNNVRVDHYRHRWVPQVSRCLVRTMAHVRRIQIVPGSSAM